MARVSELACHGSGSRLLAVYIHLLKRGFLRQYRLHSYRNTRHNPAPPPSPFSLSSQTCWSLPERGFNALRDVEVSIVPGLSALARDIANDDSCLMDSCLSAETVSLRLCGNGDRQHVVVPRVAGIFIVQTEISTRFGSGGKAARQATAVVATLEKGGDACCQGFALRMHDLKCTEGGDFLCSDIGGNSGRRRKRRSRRRGKRHVSLPVTYAALLEEAKSTPGRSPNGVDRCYGATVWSPRTFSDIPRLEEVYTHLRDE